MRGEISSARNLWHSRSRELPLPGLPPALSEDRESGAQNPFARRHSARGAAECRHQSMPPREETRSDRGPHAPGTVHPNSLFPMVVGTGIEFGGHNGRQDGALEDPSVLAQPQIALSPAEADVNASIEQEGTSQAASARWLFFLPLSASMV